MRLENKHEKFLTYHVFATLILLPCSSITCQERSLWGKNTSMAWQTIIQDKDMC